MTCVPEKNPLSGTLKILESQIAGKQKGLNKMAKIGYGHL